MVSFELNNWASEKEDDCGYSLNKWVPLLKFPKNIGGSI